MITTFSRASLAIVSSLAILIGACGGSVGPAATTNAPAGGSAVATPKERLKLTVIASTIGATALPLWLAQLDGSYEKELLDVELKVVGAASIVNSLVADQGDLAWIGPGAALAPVRNGIETSIIYAAYGAISAFVFGTPEVKTVADCKRFVVSAPGTNGYAWAVFVKNIYRANFEIVTVGDNSLIAQSLAAGTADCAATSSIFGQLVDTGRAHLIVDPRQPSALPSGWPTLSIDAAVWGIKANLQKKEEAVSRFLKALHTSINTTQKTGTSASLAEMARKHPDQQTVNQAALTLQLDSIRALVSPNAGYIRKSDWDAIRKFLIDGGFTYLDGSATWSYEQRIDMTYYEKGIGKP
jgi:ABC-type amino acid transport substrate-binding protein